MILQKILCIGIGYGFGLFQTAFLLGKWNHIDIRNYGSGKSGTTNAMRTLGKKSGLITFFGDSLKAVFAIILTYFLFQGIGTDHSFVLALYTGFGVILGHNFPFYMHFRGGKGIAAFAGMVAGLLIFDYKFVVCAAVIFFGMLFLTKYVSLSSLCMMTGFFVEMIVFGELGLVHGLNENDKLEAYILAGILLILSFIRHHDNIKRLLNGTERRIGSKKED